MAGLQVVKDNEPEQLGAPIIGKGMPAPDSAFDIRSPVSDQHGSGPWWLTQNPENDVEAVALSSILGLAKTFSLMPVFPTDLLTASSVEVVAIRDVWIPNLSLDSASDLSLRRVLRQAFRRLTVAAPSELEDAFQNCVSLLDQRSIEAVDQRGHQVRLALINAEYRELPIGKPSRKTQPVILIDLRSFRAEMG
jgi:hypothetical protein